MPTPKQLKELKPTKIRGVPSDAMVCRYELGIDEEHEGIILLEDDAPVGTPLADFMGDIVLEIDVLPNMARCLSMIGVAREVAALTGQQSAAAPARAVKADGPSRSRARSGRRSRIRSCRRATRPMLLKDVQHRPGAGLDAAAPDLRRHAADQQHRGHHQLRHARMGPAAARLRLRHAREARRRQGADHHRPPARAGEMLTTLDGNKAAS